MGYSADHLPHIGGVPGKRGLYIMAGFTGHGMAQIFSCADAFSSVVLDRCTYRASGLPRLFEETEARLHPQENLVKRSHDRAIRANKL
jgi:glycine/D-amino acid oxidase-like deaminating enzyme